MPLFQSKHIRRVLLISSVALSLAGCSPITSSFLAPSGVVAASQRQLFFDVIGWMMIVIVPVFLCVPLFAWRYRRKNSRTPYRPDWTFSWPLEILIWGVPIAIVGILSVMIVTRESPLDPYKPLASKSAKSPLEVQVVGLDWKWLFIYPKQHIATVGTLGLPVNRPVHFLLTSDTVMQSFFIPALGSQIYAMAGMVTKLNLEADRVEDTRGENTQFNGVGFQNEKFVVSVMPKQKFSAWVAKVRSTGKPLDAASYRVLSRKTKASTAHQQLGMTNTPGSILYFSTVKPRLFSSIVDKYGQFAKSDH
jgi:cytochrome o ubiquinol oxidase subunit II